METGTELLVGSDHCSWLEKSPVLDFLCRESSDGVSKITDGILLGVPREAEWELLWWRGKGGSCLEFPLKDNSQTTIKTFICSSLDSKG